MSRRKPRILATRPQPQLRTPMPARRPARIVALPVTDAARFPALDRIASLDLLRLFAALLVVFFHFGYRGAAGATPMMPVAYPEVAALAKYGFVGVDLFFLISGFVIAASADGRTAIQFAIARAARLYPAFLVAMSLTAATVVALGALAPEAALVRWAANLTMFAPALGQPLMDGAYWSIVLEIVFYGWVGLFMALGLFSSRRRTIIAVWLAICAANEVTLQFKPLRILLLTEYGPLFASGVLMHLMWTGDKSRITRLLLAVAFALGLWHATSVEATFARLYHDAVATHVLWGLHAAIYLTFAGALVLCRYVAATPAVALLGGLTYPLYLIHQEAGYALIETLTPIVGRWPAAAVALAAALLVAWSIWHFVEPTGRRLIQASLKRLVAAMPANSKPFWPAWGSLAR